MRFLLINSSSVTHKKNEIAFPNNNTGRKLKYHTTEDKVKALEKNLDIFHSQKVHF